MSDSDVGTMMLVDPEEKPMSGYTTPPDAMRDFTCRTLTFDDLSLEVFQIGHTGPAVVVLPEMPGITPELARFARWLRDAEFAVYIPSLFGSPGAVPTADDGAEVMRRACVRAEFRVLAAGGTSPIVSWLRQLAAVAHEECGGRGVGAVGMCFTGNFALAMTLDPAVIAPVLSQPSLPLDSQSSLGMSETDAEQVRQRFELEDLRALGLRFRGDKWCTAERFAAYTELLGANFKTVVLPEDAANPEPSPFHREWVVTPHSVLTVHLVDDDGHPTLKARDEVIAFLDERLTPHSATSAAPG